MRKFMKASWDKTLWRECVEVAIDARAVLKQCKYLRPLVPPIVHGKPWEEGNTHEMACDVKYFLLFEPEAVAFFNGYGEGQYFIDPCKISTDYTGNQCRNWRI